MALFHTTVLDNQIKAMPTIKSAKTNIWNEQWEAGTLEPSNGAKIASPNSLRSLDYISVSANKLYCISCQHYTSNGIRICFYNSSKTFISSLTVGANVENDTFTTPNNTAYILFSALNYILYNSTYLNDISITEQYQAVATFDTDRAERLVKCVCEVASGSSEINVVACGKNFFLHSGTIDQRNVTYSVMGDDITLTATAVAGNQQQLLMYLDSRVFGGKTITFSYDSATSSYSGAVPYVYFVVNGTTVKSLTVPSQKTFTYALPSSYTSAILLLRMYQGGSVSIGSTLTISECQLEINDEHTTFEPFGTTYNIQFGETLSDTATYDAISGVLTRNDSTTKQLDSCNIIALDNETNNVYADTGDIIDLKFVLSVGQAIS